MLLTIQVMRLGAELCQGQGRSRGQNLGTEGRLDLGGEHEHLPTCEGAKDIWKALETREPWFSALRAKWCSGFSAPS